jgi:hypothetical protein
MQRSEKQALMKRKAILSLFLLVALAAGLLGASCGSGGEPPITPPPIPEEGVYLNPTYIEAEPGEEITISIEVKPSGWGVSGGEIRLAFDPDVLQAIDIEPGSFLGSNPIVGLQQLDNQAGEISLALARVGETEVPSPAGVLVTVELKVLDSAASGVYEIELIVVGLADENFNDIVGFTVQGLTIKISS